MREDVGCRKRSYEFAGSKMYIPYVNEINIDTWYAQVCKESCLPAVPWECTFPSQMQPANYYQD